MEILAPAGNEQSAYIALKAGANAVYLGLTRFSARDSAENFDEAALKRVAQFAHILGAKVYVALNTLVKEDELHDFIESAVCAWNAGADAILLQDIFLGKLLKENYPQMLLHLSTQAGCCNVHGARLAKEYGFSRVVLARETPVCEISAISAIIETEAFVQGALCSCFSGQCYFSSFVGNNSGNRGRCKQPCRKRYSIDRVGYETPAYALSLADLSVGQSVKDLVAAGVSSLKIEGRLRREEYVKTAVEYVKACLAGAQTTVQLSRLKRAFNRGDYTRGLGFGQDKTLLSREVQGHIGERVGEISVRGGKYFCESDFSAQKGDGFKFLRGGKEVGGGAFLEGAKGGFYLSTSVKLRAGDEVRVTTDVALTSYLPKPALRSVQIEVRMVAGERPVVCSEGVTHYGDETLSFAKNAPLSNEEIIACFQKVDGLPILPQITVRTQGAFCPKSMLNAFRRAFYEKLITYFNPPREALQCVPVAEEMTFASNRKRAVIASNFKGLQAEIYILKPQDYTKITADTVACKGEKYLYLPPYFTAQDEEVIASKLHLFDGVYGDGVYALALAKKYGKKLFAGTGFNLTNRVAVAGIKAAGATYFTLSKELSGEEQRALSIEGAFALATGDIKVMDLCYCPFERTCKTCDRREVYRLIDEDGRAFPLRRYFLSGEHCRFEVYNCSPLASDNGVTGALVDLSTGRGKEYLDNAFTPDEVGRGATRGHFTRSVL